jgi:ABC-2 type transport system ATP-binding protein
MRLSVLGVSKTFRSAKLQVQALDEVSLEVSPGEILGFVGANGAGKSTLMRIIMGVISLDAGEILLNEVPANIESRQQIGYMPSERGLYPKMKVFQQLVWLTRLKGVEKPEAEQRVQKWLELLGIWDRKEELLRTLSSGNAQRAQLVAALASQPALLILDEPFSGLDPLAVRSMSTVLEQVKSEGVGVMFSSHQLELIDRLCDRVAIIQRGKIVIDGSPEQLRKAAGAPAKVEIPTPLADIFGDLIKEEAVNTPALKKMGAK